MKTHLKKSTLGGLILALAVTLLAGCVTTGAGTTTIDPPKPPGLPDPPPVTLPTPGTR